MNEDRFWLLVSLRLSGEASPEESAELDQLLKQKPELGLKAGMLNNIWSSGAAVASDKDAQFNRHMQRLSNHFAEPVLQYEDEQAEVAVISRPKTFIRRKLVLITGIAASILLVWFVAFYIPEKNTDPKHVSAQNTISTKRGSKSKVQLPDGTQVWLNADSKITYNENFQGTIREVSLTGEAFFDVVRDERRPFIIHTNTIDVKVLGTAFNVRSYADERMTETSLVHGSVEITLRSNPDRKIVLKPNEKLTVPNEMPAAEVASRPEARHGSRQPMLTVGKLNYQVKDSSAVETLWVKNKLAFDGEALEDIALKIERWFDVKLVIEDEKLKKEPFTAYFDDENLQQVMEALRITGKFKYSINKKEVIISR